jgi:hypothetical protein
MPVHTAQFTLAADVAQQIVAPDNQAQQVCIHNHEHSSNSTIYVGNETVTTITGIHSRAGETSTVFLGPGDSLFAISDTDDVQIHVLRITQD